VDHPSESDPAPRQPALGHKVKEKQANAWLSALVPQLYPGEVVLALSRTSALRPMAEGLAVTSARVVSFTKTNLSSGKFASEVLADNIEIADLQKRLSGWNCMIVVTRSGEEVNFGDIPKEDAPMVLDTVRRLASIGMSDEARRAANTQASEVVAQQAAWGGVRVVGRPLRDAAWRTLKEHSSPGETPWFIINSGLGNGLLAAFADRCMIVKVGALTSMMAGSFGGGRITTFPYTEITGIEYNAGLLNGVLEILTASYQGSTNKDYWRGAMASLNADSHNPHTLSNTLPLDKMLHRESLLLLNEMRARIAETQRPTMSKAARLSDPAGGLADELGKLAELRTQGVLDDVEFQSAKQAAIARHTSH
jgi:hypothetical protein